MCFIWCGIVCFIFFNSSFRFATIEAPQGTTRSGGAQFDYIFFVLLIAHKPSLRLSHCGRMQKTSSRRGFVWVFDVCRVWGRIRSHSEVRICSIYSSSHPVSERICIWIRHHNFVDRAAHKVIWWFMLPFLWVGCWLSPGVRDSNRTHTRASDWRWN